MIAFSLLILALGAPLSLAEPAAPTPQTAAPKEPAEPKWFEIKIASEGARPPYNFLENNELAGFEIDLGRALCQHMAIQCQFVTQDWDSMIPGLIDHQYDAIMAAFEISDEAREKITFSDPYLRMPSAFVADKKADFKDLTPKGLAGKKIGVVAGGAHEAYVQDIFDKAEVRTFSTFEEAILDLSENRIDLVMGDKDEATNFLNTNREGSCCKIIADVPRDPAYFGEGIAVGLRKGDKELKAMFNKALADVKADGTFAAIESKYFRFPIN